MPDKVNRHKALCAELNDLYARKNHDYGDSFHLTFEEEGLAMARIRLGDKFNRFKALSRGAEQLVEGKAMRDTLIDLANYALMTILELDGESMSGDEGNTEFCPDPYAVFSRKGHPMIGGMTP